MTQRNPLVRGLRFVWNGLDFVRKFLHLIVLIVLFSALLGAFSSSVPQLPSNAALLLNPQGYLVDELEGDAVTRALDELQGTAVRQTLVRDITDALDWARDDNAVQAVVLDLDGLLGGGPTKLEAVARAIEKFKTSGKPVHAFGSFYSQQSYYIAAHADEIWLNDNGGVFFDGYGVFRNYFREAIDKLDIEWNVFRVGSHKSFAEPYLRNDMSAEDRDSSLVWLTDLWQRYLADVSAAREIDANIVDSFANNLDNVLATAGGDWASAALETGLVDRLASRPEMRAFMMEIVGEDSESDGTYNAVELQRYVRSKRILNPEDIGDSNNIALVVASGPVVDGRAPPGQIGGDTTAELIRRARTDDSVSALVLRIDSGGGSVFASDVILAEILAFKATGRPVVASMGSVAASAGYWLAAPADRIYAMPTTITGSIGVVGMFPTFEKSLANLGVHSDGVGTTELAGQFRLDRALSERAKRIIQTFVNQDYDRFITGVAQYRGMEKAAVDAVAQGKVWSGEDAREIGLVDEFGGVDAAIAAAAELAGIEPGAWHVKPIAQELTPTQELLLQLTEATAAAGIRLPAGRPGVGSRLWASLQERFTVLDRYNDPRAVYSLCFCNLH